MKNLTKFGLLAVAIVGLVAPAAFADATMTHRNSVVTFSEDGGKLTSMTGWEVDGIDHLFQQWFWFRQHGVDTREIGLDELTQTLDDNDGDRFLAITGTRTGLEIEVAYLLSGGSAGSNTSDIAETITIFNTGSTAMELTFFQYSDFDLNATIADGSVTEVNENKWSQSDEAGFILSEATQQASQGTRDGREANTYANTLSSLEDAGVTTLNGVGSLGGPADLTWAWSWDFTIPAGGSVQISKDKQIKFIPAPGAIVLAMMGFGVVGWARRRLS